MNWSVFLPYVLVMAIVTYLIRMLPLVAFRKKITNRFIRSFLYYVPYGVLSAMTFPAILYATGSLPSAVVSLIVALALAWMEKSLLTVAIFASAAAFAVQALMTIL